MTQHADRHENPLPQLVAHRVRNVVNRLQRAAWVNPRPVGVAIGPIIDVPRGARDASLDAAELVSIEAGDLLGPDGGFAQRWAKLTLPDTPATNTWLRWHGQGETTLHALVGGRFAPWAGLDIAHDECPLPEVFDELWAEIGLYQTGIVNPASPREVKTPAGLRFDGAWLVDRIDDAWRAHHQLDALYQLHRCMLKDHGLAGTEWGLHQPAMTDVSPLLRHFTLGLDRVVDAFRQAGPAGVLGEIERFGELLSAELWQPVCDCVGHAHIDLVWLWPEIATKRKAIHTFSTALRLMDQDADFVYSHSSPGLLREIEQMEPELFQQMQKRIGEGRFELTGAMEVESDTHMPCGEALARGILFGQREIERIRGTASRLCWLPDVFGYSAALPQILAQSGVDRFYTSKLSWSAVTRFPHNSFVWQGHDGSELLAHVSWCGYNNEAQPETAIETARLEQQVAVHGSMLMPTGFGDGGGGPTYAMCERVRAMSDLAGVPKHRWSSAESFFDRLAPHREQLPRWRGELYLEYHRGTYTTRRDFKRAFRASERALQAHEAVAAVRGVVPSIDDAWRRVIFAQFHDAIPGSSIQRVYEELTPELEEITGDLRTASEELLQGSGDEVFNPLAISRRMVIGEQLFELPALGTGKRVEPEHPVSSDSAGRWIENGLVRAGFDAFGRLVSLWVRGQDLSPREPVGLGVYKDQPGNFDAWDIDHDIFRHRTEAEPLGCEMSGNHLRQEVRARFGFACSNAVVRWILHADEDVLRAEIELEMNEPEKLVRLEYASVFDGPVARFGCAFGAVDRRQHPRGPEEEAMWEVPASRWAAVTDGDRLGLAMMTESSYGFNARDGVLGVSLVRTPVSPDESPVPNDLGTHHVALALGAHAEKSDGGALSTASRAEALFGDVVRSGASVDSPIEIESQGSITPAWVVPVEGGFVLRVHETAGVRSSLVFQFDGRVDAVDLAGRDLPDVVERLGQQWVVTLNAYGLAGIRCLSR